MREKNPSGSAAHSNQLAIGIDNEIALPWIEFATVASDHADVLTDMRFAPARAARAAFNANDFTVRRYDGRDDRRVVPEPAPNVQHSVPST